MRPTVRHRQLFRTQTPRSLARARLQRRYDKLWAAAVGRIRAGELEIDPVLEAGVQDQRRGLTLIARPGGEVRGKVAECLSELKRVEPGQYYYASSEFHLTILSLFTATAPPEPLLSRTQRYLLAVDSALRNAEPFRIHFCGITASPGTVMVQGFFENAALNDLRNALRRELRLLGLGRGLDQRYVLETAHMTVMRFRTPLRDGKRFAALLEGARERPFGSATIQSAALVCNDWYMSRKVTNTLKRYRFGSGGP